MSLVHIHLAGRLRDILFAPDFLRDLGALALISDRRFKKYKDVLLSEGLAMITENSLALMVTLITVGMVRIDCNASDLSPFATNFKSTVFPLLELDISSA